MCQPIRRLFVTLLFLDVVLTAQRCFDNPVSGIRSLEFYEDCEEADGKSSVCVTTFHVVLGELRWRAGEDGCKIEEE